MKWAVVVVGWLLAGVTDGQADFYSGNDLHARCTDNRHIALGYVMGLSDGAEITQLFISDEAMRICVPPRATNTQLLDIVCKRLDDKPADRHKAASWLVYDAIQEAFPCPTRGAP